MARLRAAVATPLQCPVGALTLGAAPGAFQGVHAGERLLAHARVSLHPVQIFRLLLKISVEGNASELKVFLEALLRRSCVFLSKVKRLLPFSRFSTSAPGAALSLPGRQHPGGAVAVPGPSAGGRAVVRHRFSAFWLRSSVVSVLISLISDTSPTRGPYIKLIFGAGSRKRGLLRPLHASTRYCSASGNGALSCRCLRKFEVQACV